jgi:hypothetical protein
MKRFCIPRVSVLWDESSVGKVQQVQEVYLAFDVDALLTQCEEWIGGQLCPDDTGCANCKKGRELLAAIRAARGKA